MRAGTGTKSTVPGSGVAAGPAVAGNSGAPGTAGEPDHLVLRTLFGSGGFSGPSELTKLGLR